LRFSAPVTGWAVLPGLIYEQLKDDYPAEPIQEGIGFQAGAPGVFPSFPPPQGGQPSLQIAFGAGPPNRVKLSNDDGTELLLISPGSIAISCLRPYRGWERFEERIDSAIHGFVNVCDNEFSVSRIGLRYINRVFASPFDIDRYFGLRPVSFEDMPLRLSTFVCRSELPSLENENHLVIATFASTLAPEGPAIVLDIDAIAQNLEQISSIDSLWLTISELRLLEKRAFESSITNEARNGPFGGFEVIADVS
jgi:uncharacterized protein (TIGR04255 family)